MAYAVRAVKRTMGLRRVRTMTTKRVARRAWTNVERAKHQELREYDKQPTEEGEQEHHKLQRWVIRSAQESEQSPGNRERWHRNCRQPRHELQGVSASFAALVAAPEGRTTAIATP
ncbi:hypothetical protein GLOTRDRAFT_134342 [Gloeophyllum trabeum ATCC 11539]|uniref:Uncharacterized protein n=1 Tax=Gloeophyllum trabeum (strain ATCC 11539 / FP-39264 / Madison 617) TaxID=670483 RepID=S7PRL3_GLOTA|nr:uncharacterized protein GLOTRDRAFT_134342 [Gloeophyllum trabeum ATCC 11539]EPQ50013.1 hypothetical protein GLOTRDRAFT_134342 [Gloeophyllum trabeum ATCC 11539]